jgi:hypothetical protein
MNAEEPRIEDRTTWGDVAGAIIAAPFRRPVRAAAARDRQPVSCRSRHPQQYERLPGLDRH